MAAAAWEHTANKGWATSLIAYQDSRAALTRSIIDNQLERVVVPPDPGSLSRCWQGPLNVRALIGAMPIANRRAAARLLRADRDNHVLLSELAFRADGSRSRKDIIFEVSLARRNPAVEEAAEVLVDGLIASGWLSEV